MSFVLSVLYLVTYYLTPLVIFGPLAAFHIELILAALVLIVSLPKLTGSFILKTPQTLALIGMAMAVVLSILSALHWVGGAVQAFLDFIPNAFAFFLVCLHCNSKRKLQVLVLMLLFVCLFVIAHGIIDLRQGVSVVASPQPGTTVSPYLFAMRNDAGDRFYRLKGQGGISDPNDFAQLIVSVIPLLFIFWRPKRIFQNTAFVLLPMCALLYGAFMTHSRGALMALVAVAILAFRRYIGTVPALVLAVGLFVAASALNFTGGREISASAGSDRTSLWGVGLQMLKSHPLLGVGFGNFGDQAGKISDDPGLTAHNSIVVCAAELGLFGLFFWTLFLFPTMRDALEIASPAKVGDGGPIIAAEELFPQAPKKIEIVERAEVIRMGRLIVFSLTGFLVAGLFLSRAYVMTWFLLGGIAETIYEMALHRGMVAGRMPMKRILLYAGGLTVAIVPFMYIMVRFLNLMH